MHKVWSMKSQEIAEVRRNQILSWNSSRDDQAKRKGNRPNDLQILYHKLKIELENDYSSKFYKMQPSLIDRISETITVIHSQH